MYKFALIGCGKVSQRHAASIQQAGQLKAVCDLVKERADALAREYSCTAYYSIDDLLKQEPQIDIVSVCTPNGFHAEHSIKALQAGKHVLCEKPLCLTSAAAWQLIETEKFCRRKLFVVQSNRYNPVLLQLKTLLDEGQLGRVYSFQLSCIWNRPPEYFTGWRGHLFPDGGTLYTQFSHYIDSLTWLMGEVEEVKGFRKNLAHGSTIEFEDTGVAALLMNNGSLGSLHWSINSYKKDQETALTLVAEKGTIRIGGPRMNEIQYQSMARPIEFPMHENRSGDSTSKVWTGEYTEVYRHLQKALREGDPSLGTAYDDLRTVETIEKIYKAMGLPA